MGESWVLSFPPSREEERGPGNEVVLIPNETPSSDNVIDIIKYGAIS